MGKRLKVEATAYGPPWDAMEGTGVTSTGVNLKHGQQKLVVAVDPSVIPYGTKLRIPDNPFGDPNLIFTASDTGGAFQGGKHAIDFFVASGRKHQNRWGRRSVDVEIVGHGSPKDVAILGQPRKGGAAVDHVRSQLGAQVEQPEPVDTGPSERDVFFANWLKQHKPGSVLTKVGKYADLLNGVQQHQQQPDLLKQVAALKMPKQAPLQGPADRPAGHVKFAPGADRAGVHTQQIVKSFLEDTSASAKGRTLTVGTGTNHSKQTTSGNVSDHWTGHGADIPVPVDSRDGDLIAAHTLQQLGIPWKKAFTMAKQGGLYTITPTSGKYKGHRVQVIWKTYEGGDHHNHVHVGIQ